MSAIERKLAEMGLTLPPAREFPSANRRGCVQVGSILFVSGHGPHGAIPGVKDVGKLDGEITVEEGYLAAKAAALCILATLKDHLSDLDRVERVVRLFGMVNSTPDFDRHPAVIDGASDLFYALWGPERGRHARSAIGMANLPRRMPVEINGEFEVKI